MIGKCKISQCGRISTRPKSGYCDAHYLRWIRYGDTRANDPIKEIDRHGGARKNGKKTSEYETWLHLRQRCINPKDKEYKNYGARGIAVCDRWKSFRLFYLDMGPRPSKKFSIDRRDNNRGYSPKNCYWATMKQQNRNRRSTVFSVSMAKEIRRFRKQGWPLKKIGKHFNVNWRSLEHILYFGRWNR